MKYYGGFKDRESMFQEFHYEYGRDKYDIPDNFPTDAEVLIAAYEGGPYEGAAFVLYKKDGKLYEVNGGHCSCYGLEDQWSPEETSVEALKMRKFSTYDYEPDTIKAIEEAIEKAAL